MPASPPSASFRVDLIYLVIAVVWGIAFAFLVPPLQVPDEGDHWFRAWAITDGQLVADREGMVQVPGEFTDMVDLYTALIATQSYLPLSLEGQPGFTTYEALFNGPTGLPPVKTVSRVQNYGPVGYLPQAAGIAIGRMVDAPPLASFYLARLANLLVAIVIVFFAIRIAPFGKQLFAFAALLPMTMYEFASVASDALTIAGAMLFIALALRSLTRISLRGREIALLIGSAALFLNIKPGYWGLVLLLFLLRPRQLGGRVRYAAFIAAAWLLVAAVFIVEFTATSAASRIAGDAGPKVQLLWIGGHPLDFLGITLENVERWFTPWLLETIGVLGWLNVWLPRALYLVVIVLGIAAFFRRPEAVPLDARQRLLLVVTAAATFLSMAVALYAVLEPVGSDRIFFQGRYLAPVGLVALLSVYGLWFARRRIGTLFFAGVLVVVALESLRTIITTYYP